MADETESATPSSTADPAPVRELALEVEHLSKHYEGALAVQDLSFRVARGEILGVVGPNGAGKTTTLRSVTGILPLQQGVVRVAGVDLAREEARAKRGLAWIPDDPQPFDSLTVVEHLEFTAALYGVRDWRARADELLARFELAEKKEALGGELSRGMRQKLAFCCAWLHQPAVVLMDEMAEVVLHGEPGVDLVTARVPDLLVTLRVRSTPLAAAQRRSIESLIRRDHSHTERLRAERAERAPRPQRAEGRA